MMTYPAYTVRRIRDELTPRRARELLTCAAKDQPSWAQLAKLNAILCGLLDIGDPSIPEPVKSAEECDRDIRSALMAMGEDFTITFEG